MKLLFLFPGSIVREKVIKNELQHEEENFLKNLYDSTTEITTLFTYDLFSENMKLICPQIINSNYVHTSKDLDLIFRLNKFLHQQMVHHLGKWHRFYLYSDTMAWGWRGGDRKFSPNSEAKNEFFPLGIWREFSNTSSPSLSL